MVIMSSLIVLYELFSFTSGLTISLGVNMV